MSSYAILNGSFDDKTLLSLELIKKEGNYLIDKDERKYLDLKSGLWNVSLGYDNQIHQIIAKKFQDTLKNGIAFLDINSFKNPLYDSVSQKILDCSKNDFSKVIFTNSGSENTEVILKIVNYINKKSEVNKILAFNESYHGTFLGGIATSGSDKKINKSFSTIYGEVTFLDYPQCKEDEERILHQVRDTSAQYDAIFIEPILVNGVYPFNSDFLNQLIRILKSNHVIVVFDETVTGFYKTGLPFYYHHLEEIPDIISLSKGINNGIVPFGCVCVTEDINTRLLQSYCVKKHLSTQNGNLLGMIATDTVLNYYQNNHDNLKEKISKISEIINEICHQYCLSYRNIGVMTAIEVNSHIHILQCVKELSELGVLVHFYLNKQSQGLVIMPQFNIAESDLRKALILIAQKVAT